MSKLNKFEVFKAAYAMSGQGSMWDNDFGKYRAVYLLHKRLAVVGDQFSVDDAVEIKHEAEAFQEEFDAQLGNKST